VKGKKDSAAATGGTHRKKPKKAEVITGWVRFAHEYGGGETREKLWALEKNKQGVLQLMRAGETPKSEPSAETAPTSDALLNAGTVRKVKRGRWGVRGERATTQEILKTKYEGRNKEV